MVPLSSMHSVDYLAGECFGVFMVLDPPWHGLGGDLPARLKEPFAGGCRLILERLHAVARDDFVMDGHDMTHKCTYAVTHSDLDSLISAPH